jgi:hypothetical protein
MLVGGARSRPGAHRHDCNRQTSGAVRFSACLPAQFCEGAAGRAAALPTLQLLAGPGGAIPATTIRHGAARRAEVLRHSSLVVMYGRVKKGLALFQMP